MNHVVIEQAPERVERRSLVIDATPEAIFELLADPGRHHEFDGSETVRRSTEETPDRLSLGAKFGMKMKLVVPYSMSNEVVEFVENESIAWTHIGGHVWRYTLDAVDGGETKVTEEFDWRPSSIAFFLKATKAPSRNADAIEKTLPRLADIVTTVSG